jgi:uncharacterized membrane protein
MDEILASARRVIIERLKSLLDAKIAGRDATEVAVWLMIIVYTIVFSYFTIMKHNAFRSFAWDLGIVNQALSTTLNSGKFLYYTPELFFNLSGCYFGLHFSPVLILLLPIYSIYPGAEVLLVFQSSMIALGALPLYWFASERLKNNLVAAGFSLAYILYPILHGANWFDFHIQCMLPVFFFSAMYHLEQESWTKYFVFTFLALAVGESVSLVVFFMGVYGVLKYRSLLSRAIGQRKLDSKKVLIPIVTLIVSTIWFLASKWIQNSFFPVDPAFMDYYKAVDWWSVLGIAGDPIRMPIHILLNPLRVAQALTYDAYLKLLYFVLAFGSLLFLPFKSSVTLITLPVLLPAFLSNYSPFYMLGVHYPLYYIPFLFLATVEGAKKYKNGEGTAIIKGRIKSILMILVIFSLFASPLSPLLNTMEVPIPHFSDYSLPIVSEHETILQGVIALVPSNVSILTQNNIFPHFSNRLEAYVYPLPHVFDFAPREAREYVDQIMLKSEYVLVDTGYDRETALHIISDVTRRYEGFTVLRYEDGIYLYKRDL